jgi:hypothetical protein
VADVSGLSEGQEAFIREDTGVTALTTADTSEGFIVEGTGRTGQIRTRDNRFSLIDEYPVTSSQLQATNTQQKTEQKFLQNHASNTVSDQNQLYTNFPAPLPTDPATPRDPIAYFQQQVSSP